MLLNKPRLLDLFCGAGGAAMGYHRAGFAVYGIDNKPQPHYPFPFCKMDALLALDLLLGGKRIYDTSDNWWSLSLFDVIHASPPCQGESNMTPIQHRGKTPTGLFIKETRNRLLKTGLPFVIENVTGARKLLITPVKLCGSHFGLPIYYHRYFECNGFYCLSRTCHHDYKPVVTSGGPNANGWGKPRPHAKVEDRRKALGVDWMVGAELNEAIPPVYTEYIGKYLMQEVLRNKKCY